MHDEVAEDRELHSYRFYRHTQMNKNNNAAGGIPQHHSKKPYLVSIVSISPARYQFQRYKRLAQAVGKGEFTESLEMLAESQIEGDLAIFILVNFQQMGVAG